MTTSTTPDDPTLLIHAYVDGELDPANALDVERRIAADPALAAERDRVTALRAALNRHFPREPAPASLRKRVEMIGGVRRVELAVAIGVHEQDRIVRHVRHADSFPSCAISRRRARASRDITVPIGTPVTSAMLR